MLILAFDTSFAMCSAALWRDGRTLAHRALPMERGHSEALVPMLHALTTGQGLRFPDLDRLAVTVGPGGFTGIRIGLAAGRGLALACGRPLVGVTTLEAVARSVPAEARDGRSLVVALDAGRADLYVQCFGPLGFGPLGPVGPVAAIAPGHPIPGLGPGPVLVAGNGSARLVGALAAVGREVAEMGDMLPDAVRVAEIAAERADADCMRPPGPLYIHPTYAKLPEPRTRTANAPGGEP
ncbi:MAG: tRNA (adenosine(37)-N6)-threonylcarbamoyltransferase complex dimerization subunit type 1 TsaB [Alphaproteobacteria bacterium]